MDAKGNVYVADRSNRRIQVFDNDLNFKAIYDNVGTPWELCISPGPHQYLFSSNSFPDANDYTLATVTGEVYKMELDGTSSGSSEKRASSWASSADCMRSIAAIPDVLYISEIQLWRAQKLILHPNGK